MMTRVIALSFAGCIALFGMAGQVSAESAGPAAAEHLRLAASGERVQLHSPLGDLTAEAGLEGCKPDGMAEVKPTASNGMQVIRRMQGPAGQKCTITETFTPMPTSVRWEIEIFSKAAQPWTAPIVTRLGFPVSKETRFWTAWMMTADPLEIQPLQDALWHYGKHFAPGVSIPLASIMDVKTDSGLSIVFSPEDTLLDAELQTTASGTITFRRKSHRLGQNRKIAFAMDVTFHEADWRGGLRWMVKRYRPYFDPPNPKALEMAGCGAYSGWDGSLDAERIKRMGLRVLWDAAFDWPYFGMFIPPVADDGIWYSAGQDFSGNPRAEHSRKRSYSLMNERARRLHAAGLHPLNYFILSEFGTNLAGRKTPGEAWRPAGDESWADQFGYLRGKLADSIYLDEKGAEATVWGQTVIMDPAGHSYKAHIVEQVRRHIEKLPDWEGFVCDRMYWPQRVNSAADDGVGWYDGRPGRHFTVSYREGMAAVADVIHKAGKVIFCNPCMAYRLDCYRNVDGFFDERYGSREHAINGSAMLGIRKPVVIWVDSADEVKADPNAFFHRHLHLGAYPMAPFPNNDHSIRPDPEVEKWYMDYGPLFDAMRGKKWVLEPHCIEIEGGKAKANLFEVSNGWVAPVTFGPKDGTVKVLIRNVPGISDKLKFDALHPGVEQPQPVKATQRDGVLELEVPLQRSCAMVRITPTPQANTKTEKK